MTEYETKDSGARAEFSGGYVRDTNEGKPRFDLLLMAGVPYDQQPLYREAMLMARGAEKYDARNHELAYGYVQHTDIPEEEARFVESLLRHAVQLACGENDEDHASAVCFNARGVAMMRQRLEPTTQQEMKMTFTVLGEGVETYHNLTVTNTDTGEKTLLRGVKVSDADIDDVELSAEEVFLNHVSVADGIPQSVDTEPIEPQPLYAQWSCDECDDTFHTYTDGGLRRAFREHWEGHGGYLVWQDPDTWQGYENISATTPDQLRALEGETAALLIINEMAARYDVPCDRQGDDLELTFEEVEESQR